MRRLLLVPLTLGATTLAALLSGTTAYANVGAGSLAQRSNTVDLRA